MGLLVRITCRRRCVHGLTGVYRRSHGLGAKARGQCSKHCQPNRQRRDTELSISVGLSNQGWIGYE